jgi:hypothetical protein
LRRGSLFERSEKPTDGGAGRRDQVRRRHERVPDSVQSATGGLRRVTRDR